jgi:hypothetical protein
VIDDGLFADDLLGGGGRREEAQGEGRERESTGDFHGIDLGDSGRVRINERSQESASEELVRVLMRVLRREL